MKPNRSQFDAQAAEAPEWWATTMTSDEMASIQGPEDVGAAPDKDSTETSEWLEKITEKNTPPF